MNILIIDDHPLFIDGISHVVNQLSGSVVIKKAMSSTEAIEQLESTRDFDIILLDLMMPGIDGLSFLQRYKADELCIPLVVVSAEEQVGLIARTLEWGSMGFIPKAYTAEKMLHALRRILEGDIYIPEHIQRLLNRLPAPQRAKDLPCELQASGISKKQFEVLELVAKGHSNQQIAVILNRTEHTVKSHVAALLQILDANNRSECAEIARKRGLVNI